MQIVLIVIGALVVSVFIFRTIAIAKIKKTPMVADHPKILTLTDRNFQQQTKNKLVLVDFWAAWCAPCRMMAPILNELADELPSGSHVGKVDIEQYQSLAQQFKVRGIPTMILFKNGKEVNRFVGVKQKNFLLQQVQKA